MTKIHSFTNLSIDNLPNCSWLRIYYFLILSEKNSKNGCVIVFNPWPYIYYALSLSTELSSRDISVLYEQIKRKIKLLKYWKKKNPSIMSYINIGFTNPPICSKKKKTICFVKQFYKYNSVILLLRIWCIGVYSINSWLKVCEFSPKKNERK